MGLGGFPDVPLAMAREKAREARLQIERGVDPIQAKREAKSALKATAAAARTFRECAVGYMDAKSDEWRNPKHRQQWTNTLEQYAYPVVGDMLVRDVGLCPFSGSTYRCRCRRLKRYANRSPTQLGYTRSSRWLPVHDRRRARTVETTPDAAAAGYRGDRTRADAHEERHRLHHLKATSRACARRTG
jgi:hypothetical protein